jgi:hypothetical protein
MEKILNRECDVYSVLVMLTHDALTILALAFLVFGRFVDTFTSALRKPLAPFIVDEPSVQGF